MATATVAGLSSDTMSVSPPPSMARVQSVESLQQTMANLGFDNYTLPGVKPQNQNTKPEQPKNDDEGGGMIMSGVMPHGPLSEAMHIMHGAEVFRDETKQKELPQGDPAANIRFDGKRPVDLTLESRLRNPYESLTPTAPAPGPKYSGPRF